MSTKDYPNLAVASAFACLNSLGEANFAIFKAEFWKRFPPKYRIIGKFGGITLDDCHQSWVEHETDDYQQLLNYMRETVLEKTDMADEYEEYQKGDQEGDQEGEMTSRHWTCECRVNEEWSLSNIMNHFEAAGHYYHGDFTYFLDPAPEGAYQ